MTDSHLVYVQSLGWDATLVKGKNGAFQPCLPVILSEFSCQLKGVDKTLCFIYHWHPI